VSGLLKASDSAGGLNKVAGGKYSLENLLGGHDSEYYKANHPYVDPVLSAQIAAEQAASSRYAATRRRRAQSTLFGSRSVLGSGGTSGGGPAGTVMSSGAAPPAPAASSGATAYANSWRTGLP
jgi:hypothetical protein